MNHKNIPSPFNNFKIISISDLHNKSFGKDNDILLNKIKKQRPDIIVITGDLIDSYQPNLNRVYKLISKIVDIVPIYYVNGNHELRFKDYQLFEDNLKSLGVHILNNKIVKLTREQETINLIGINDPSKYQSLSISNDHLNKLLTQTKHADYTILLSHRPELMPLYKEKNINLILSGHAHGGQIRLPFTQGLYAPNQGFFPIYTAGYFIENDTAMVVSRGLGPSSFPLRINNKPDLVEIILYIEK